MPPLLAFVLGLLLGLGVAALLVAGLLRGVGRITGTAPQAVAALVVDGLQPGARQDGVAAQRALARRLKRANQRTAAGRRVAATTLRVHVSPEDHALIDEAMGIDAAAQDLREFYRTHASRSGWLVGAEPRLELVRDISLRPRQAFVRAETAAVPGEPPAEAAEPDRPPVQPRQTASVPVVPVVDEAAVTDVLPRGLADPDAAVTAVYPAVDQAAPGDLVVVHGTDVRVVPASLGLLTVGRGSHNDVVLDAPGVGRDHLLIERRTDGWWVVPGTTGAPPTLDGRRLTAPARIDGQGRVELGRGARLQVSVEPAR